MCYSTGSWSMRSCCIDIFYQPFQSTATTMICHMIILLPLLGIVLGNPVAIDSNGLSMDTTSSPIEVQDSSVISVDPEKANCNQPSANSLLDDGFQNLDRRSPVECPVNPTTVENPSTQPEQESTGTGNSKKGCTDPRRSKLLTCGGREVISPTAKWILFVTNCVEGMSHPWRIIPPIELVFRGWLADCV